MPGSIKIDDGSGNYTILTNAGSLGSDKTITIPNTTGTLALTSDSFGKVLQVVSTTYSTAVVNSGTSYVDSGLSLAITPSSTSSKVLVMIQQSLYVSSSSYSYEGVDYKLLRDTTDLIEDNTYGKNFIQYSGTILLKTDANYFYVDTPSTTSSTTYKTQFMPHRTDVSTTAAAQNGSSTSTMVLMEIAG